jgi:hypothetical protein
MNNLEYFVNQKRGPLIRMVTLFGDQLVSFKRLGGINRNAAFHWMQVHGIIPSP